MRGIRLLYFDGCPNWQTTNEQLRRVLDDLGLNDVEVELHRVETSEEAERLRFIGSPTILIDGRDPFAQTDASSYGLSCRVYGTPEGLAGTPSTEQLRAAIREAQATR